MIDVYILARYVDSTTFVHPQQQTFSCFVPAQKQTPQQNQDFITKDVRYIG